MLMIVSKRLTRSSNFQDFGRCALTKKGYIARELLKRIWTLDIDWLNMYFATRISIGYAAIMHLRDDTIQG